MDFFGLDVAMIGYQGTVFPVLLAVWFMSHLEKQLRRRIPDALDLILTPFLTVIITGFVALLFIGPAGRVLGDGISFGLSALYEQAGWLAGLVFGGTYSLIVITGIHHSFHAIEAGCWPIRRSASTSCCPSGPWPTWPRAGLAWRSTSRPGM